jgi:hypothetical protein
VHEHETGENKVEVIFRQTRLLCAGNTEMYIVYPRVPRFPPRPFNLFSANIDGKHIPARRHLLAKPPGNHPGPAPNIRNSHPRRNPGGTNKPLGVGTMDFINNMKPMGAFIAYG